MTNTTIVAGAEAPHISTPCTGLNSFLDAALCWFDFGFKVIPITPGEKKSAVKWTPWEMGLSPIKIAAHWERHPDHEVGFIVGEDHIVFDADTQESIAALREIEKAHGVTPSQVVKTKHGEHHHFRRASGTHAKSDSHSTEDHPDRIDIKTGRALGILPPSTDKTVSVCTAKNAEDLTEIGQDFIDAVFTHNGRDVPRRTSKSSSAIHPTGTTSPPTESSNWGQKLIELRAMLDHIDPDAGYDGWLHVLMAIYHESGGSEDGFAIANEWSSRGSKYAGQDDIETKWRSFADYDGTPITVATIRKELTDQGIDWVEVCAAAGPQFKPCETEVIHADTVPPTAPKQTPSPLEKYTLLGMSGELEKQAVDEVSVLGPLALKGELTVWYAAPNTGKTLLTLSLLVASIKANAIDPDRVFYVNVDDSLKGLTQKLSIAEEYGFHMLAEGHRDFRSSDFRSILHQVLTDGHARDSTIILDTLKKFVDLMDKAKTSGLNKLIRQFVMQGGTLIALAHTNKNRRDGKPVYGGTTDMVDDADCAYIIDTLDASDPAHKVVVFENIKRRGDNASRACYRYSQESGQSYEALLASVERIEEAELLTLTREAELRSDAPVIDAIVSAIQDGVTTKMKLADAAAERAGCSRRAALKVIEQYTGSDPSMHRWTFDRGKHGAKVYALMPKDTPNA